MVKVSVFMSTSALRMTWTTLTVLNAEALTR